MTLKTDFETIILAVGTDKVGVVTLNRPEAMNSMNTLMMRELRDCFMQFYVDPTVATCLVITGALSGASRIASRAWAKMIGRALSGGILP